MNVVFSSAIPAIFSTTLLKSSLLLSLSAGKCYCFPMLLMLWFHFFVFCFVLVDFCLFEGEPLLCICTTKSFYSAHLFDKPCSPAFRVFWLFTLMVKLSYWDLSVFCEKCSKSFCIGKMVNSIRCYVLIPVVFLACSLEEREKVSQNKVTVSMSGHRLVESLFLRV